VHVQLTHRVLAVLVVLHLIGLASGIYRRGEASIAKRAVTVAVILGLAQLGVAAAMVLGNLPPVLRSLHEATGVSIWIATFTLAYLSRIASGGSAVALTGEIDPLVGETRGHGASRGHGPRVTSLGSPRGVES
jgi:heme A synthase